MEKDLGRPGGLSSLRDEASKLSSPKASIPDADWTKYTDRRPKKGVVEWRMASTGVDGLTVRFLAHMRERGAGYTTTLSPIFDHWDGFKVHVPDGLEWRYPTSDIDIKNHETKKGLVLEGLHNSPCPYCLEIPVWHGVRRSGRGVIIGAAPHEYNSWWLKCCAWAKTPHENDPRAMADKRNSALAKAIEAGTAETGTGSVHESAVGNADLPKG